MGIPKFYRFMCERYPCVQEVIKETQVQDFDYLYLDMNGILHVCSHSDDDSVQKDIPEEEIFKNIFHYLDVLFYIVQPKKLLFMAVDGVAPRAKMNQQRGRRFKTAKDRETLINKLTREGKTEIPRFDSNCITPGTQFMIRLQEQLEYYIISRVSNDHLWQNCKVVLSGHEVPGEGEHKIMDCIRFMKTLPDYDPSARHCIYGLDADLLILGLCTHERNICILREEVHFRRRTRRVIRPEETKFCLTHLSLLKEYLDLEFKGLKTSLPFEYNLEKILDDWVLICFLVGNDFVPHLPDFHIDKGAIPVLYRTYAEVLPTLNGYMNENGYLNLSRFRIFIGKLAEFEFKNFKVNNFSLFNNEIECDWKPNSGQVNQYKPKSSAKKKLTNTNDTSSVLEEVADNGVEDDEVYENNQNDEKDIKDKDDEEYEEYEEDEDDEDDEDDEADEEDEKDEDVKNKDDKEKEEDDEDYYAREFTEYKRNYYTTKMHYSEVTEEFLKSQAEEYIRGLQWTLHYYYHGCQSWSWFYPEHYAPCTSDIVNFEGVDLKFEMGKPFLPYEQLLAVLPPASKDLLPKAYRNLMISPDSPIKEYYPETFRSDLNGKQRDWEAIILLPMINEKVLLDAMKSCNGDLTRREKYNNKHRPMLIYSYTDEDLGTYEAPRYFTTVLENHALVQTLKRDDVVLSISQVNQIKRSYPNPNLCFLGFPTLAHVNFEAEKRFGKIRVFNYTAKVESIVLKITQETKKNSSMKKLGEDLLGKTVYVNWPFLYEARIVAVANKDFKCKKTGNRIRTKKMKPDEKSHWARTCSNMTLHYLDTRGIDIGSTEFMVYVNSFKGIQRSCNSDATLCSDKVWSQSIDCYPLQTIVRNVDIIEPHSMESNTIEEPFPLNSVVFMLGFPYYGCKGQIAGRADKDKNNRVLVELEIPEEYEIHRKQLYKPDIPYISATPLGIAVKRSPNILGKIAGSILIDTSPEDMGEESELKKRNNVNIGLLLKSSKTNEKVPGYTEKADVWKYSDAAAEVMEEYVQKFPEVIHRLEKQPSEVYCFPKSTIFPGDEGHQEFLRLLQWLKGLECSQIPRVSCESQVLKKDVVSRLVKETENHEKKISTTKILVKPQFLYRSELQKGEVVPVVTDDHQLLDRVVCTKPFHTVPLGLRGYIIGIVRSENQENMYDVLYDEPFPGGKILNCCPSRGFRMSVSCFVNISHGERTSALKKIPKGSKLGIRRRGNTSDQAQDRSNSSAAPPRKGRPDQFESLWTALGVGKPRTGRKDTKVLKTEQDEKVTDIEDKSKRLSIDGFQSYEESGFEEVRYESQKVTDFEDKSKRLSRDGFQSYEESGSGVRNKSPKVADFEDRSKRLSRDGFKSYEESGSGVRNKSQKFTDFEDKSKRLSRDGFQSYEKSGSGVRNKSQKFTNFEDKSKRLSRDGFQSYEKSGSGVRNKSQRSENFSTETKHSMLYGWPRNTEGFARNNTATKAVNTWEEIESKKEKLIPKVVGKNREITENERKAAEAGLAKGFVAESSQSSAASNLNDGVQEGNFPSFQFDSTLNMSYLLHKAYVQLYPPQTHGPMYRLRHIWHNVSMNTSKPSTENLDQSYSNRHCSPNFQNSSSPQNYQPYAGSNLSGHNSSLRPQGPNFFHGVNNRPGMQPFQQGSQNTAADNSQVGQSRQGFNPEIPFIPLQVMSRRNHQHAGQPVAAQPAANQERVHPVRYPFGFFTGLIQRNSVTRTTRRETRNS